MLTALVLCFTLRPAPLSARYGVSNFEDEAEETLRKIVEDHENPEELLAESGREFTKRLERIGRERKEREAAKRRGHEERQAAAQYVKLGMSAIQQEERGHAAYTRLDP